jgi:hypothetical protein
MHLGCIKLSFTLSIVYEKKTVLSFVLGGEVRIIQ